MFRANVQVNRALVQSRTVSVVVFYQLKVFNIALEPAVYWLFLFGLHTVYEVRGCVLPMFDECSKWNSDCEMIWICEH